MRGISRDQFTERDIQTFHEMEVLQQGLFRREKHRGISKDQRDTPTLCMTTNQRLQPDNFSK